MGRTDQLMARPYLPSLDYTTVREWWLSRGLTASVVPSDCLPPTGVIVVSSDIPCCAGWVHCDKYSYFGQIGNLVTNPEISPKLRVKSIELCFDRLILMAEKEGVTNLTARFAENGLLALLRRRGFSQHPIPMMELEKRIG